MYSDFHLHSRFSGDSEENPESIVKKAIELGMEQICITDHQDLDFPEIPAPVQPVYEIDPEEYFGVWHALKEKYAAHIDISIGLEAGIEPHTYEEQLQRTKAVPYDFIINSCHVVTRDLSYYPDFFARYGTREGMRMYLECVLYNISKFENYDVVGHIDFLLRYAPEKEGYRPEENMDVAEKILRKSMEDGKGIEVNTAGFRTGTGDSNPCRLILKKYREIGGEILTIGSDAHVCRDIGADFKKIGEILKDIGFKYYCTFKGRKATFHPL